MALLVQRKEVEESGHGVAAQQRMNVPHRRVIEVGVGSEKILSLTQRSGQIFQQVIGTPAPPGRGDVGMPRREQARAEQEISQRLGREPADHHERHFEVGQERPGDEGGGDVELGKAAIQERWQPGPRAGDQFLDVAPEEALGQQQVVEDFADGPPIPTRPGIQLILRQTADQGQRLGAGEAKAMEFRFRHHGNPRLVGSGMRHESPDEWGSAGGSSRSARRPG